MGKPVGAMRLMLHPLTLKEAKKYMDRHRHHRPPTGGLFAIGCALVDDEEPCGIVIVGRPIARLLDNGWTVEVTRCCTDGTPNACSMLYRAAWRAAKAMGYRKLVTYTLPQEGGASLRGAGFRLIGECGGGSWNRPHCDRPRVDLHPTQMKLRWEIEEIGDGRI